MTMHDPAKEQPERFKRAVRAACNHNNLNCSFPECDCDMYTEEMAILIREWETIREPLT